MARYIGPKCKLSRREGTDLFLKSGVRALDSKCKLETPPGVHGQRRGRLSEYGTQLREKQKVRRMYGVLERQFRNYFASARNMPGITGSNLLQLLERRLDNVTYRVGFGDSRAQARQRVLHGHFTVNGRKVDIPSFVVKAGDEVGWKASSMEKDFVKEIKETIPKRAVPRWLELDAANLTGKVSNLPEEQDIGATVDTRLIVEFYSR